MPKFTHIFCDSDIRNGFMFARKYSGHKVHLITMCPTLVGWDKENDKEITDGTYYILNEKVDLSRGYEVPTKLKLRGFFLMQI